MKNYREQLNITLTDEQVNIVKEKIGTLKIRELAKELDVTYNKLWQNLKLLGYVKSKASETKVVNMQDYFNLNEFAKYYQY